MDRVEAAAQNAQSLGMVGRFVTHAATIGVGVAFFQPRG